MRPRSAGSAILAFYRGAGPDHRGRLRDDIRAFGVDRLESTHDFIQWLFPLPEPSGANPHAPLLRQADIAAFAADPELRRELLRSLEVMLGFYGLKLAGTEEEPRVERGANYPERSAEWLERSHNFLRLSRILRCLSLLGCRNHALAFLECLEGVYRENPEAVGSDSLGYWRRACGLPG